MIFTPFPFERSMILDLDSQNGSWLPLSWAGRERYGRDRERHKCPLHLSSPISSSSTFQVQDCGFKSKSLTKMASLSVGEDEGGV